MQNCFLMENCFHFMPNCFHVWNLPALRPGRRGERAIWGELRRERIWGGDAERKASQHRASGGPSPARSIARGEEIEPREDGFREFDLPTLDLRRKPAEGVSPARRPPTPQLPEPARVDWRDTPH